jgi:hypothetical protein
MSLFSIQSIRSKKQIQTDTIHAFAYKDAGERIGHNKFTASLIFLWSQ